MKILFVGDSLSIQYVTSFYNEAKEREGIIANLFDYGKLRRNNVFTKFEMHYKFGFLICNLNKRLIRECYKNRYDLVFVYYSTLVFGSTIKEIRKTGAKVFLYCNDNPFSEGYKWYTWKHFKKQLPFYDIVYAYRESNIVDYKKHGAQEVKLLKSYFIEERNYYIPDDQIELIVPRVVYIGHKEDDGRESYIEALLKEGIEVGLNCFWDEYGMKYKNAQIFDKETSTIRYNDILNKAQIAIVFLSQLNKDNYTRRCFEIPAVKTMMIAPYTEELAKMYQENVEIVFFRNASELVTKIKHYLDCAEERISIAEAGYERLMRSGNEVSNRIDQVIKDFCEIE